MSNQHPETLKIKVPVSEDNELGIVVINASDFVEGEHELADEEGQTGSVKGPEDKGAPAPQVEKAPAGTTVQSPAWAK